MRLSPTLSHQVASEAGSRIVLRSVGSLPPTLGFVPRSCARILCGLGFGILKIYATDSQSATKYLF